MGSDRAKLSTRCCYAAVSIVVLSAMFWIAWCVFSVTAVPVSESQRRAIVHYSPTPSTPAEETSAFNAISKLPTTSSLGKDKGDFAPREVNTGDSKPVRIPALKGDGPSTVEVQARRVVVTAVENRPEKKVEPNPDRTAISGALSDSRSEIRPSAIKDETKTEVVQSSRRAEDEPIDRVPEFEKGETRRRVVPPKPDRGRQNDDERGSRDKFGGVDRGRESDERYSKGDTRVYPDVADDVRSGNTGKEDRVRKGDEDEDDHYRYRESRPRPADDESYRSRKEERPRYRDEERYRDRDGDKGRDRDVDRYRDRDDDKYRDRDADRYRDRDDEKYRDRDDDKIKDRDVDRYRDRDGDRYRDRVDDRPRSRDEYRYRDRDDDRYRDRDDDRYRDRDDDKYRDRDDDKYKDRDDDKYRDRDDRYRYHDDEGYKSRDDDRYRDRKEDRPKYRDEERPSTGDDERYILRKEDDKYRYRGNEKYGPRDDDEKGERRYLSREDDRRRSSEEKGYRSREDDDKYLSPSVSASSKSDSIGDRKQTSNSRYEYRSDETVTDYDIPVRPREERPPRPAYDEDRKRGWDDEERRPYTYEKDRLEISPTRTRTREDSSISGPSRSRSSDDDNDRKYVYSLRSRTRDDERTVVQGSRRTYSADDASRRYTDERETYRPVSSTRSYDRGEDVVLDRRSHIADDEYRKSSRRNDDRDRRRYEDEDSYSRRDRVDEEDEYRRDRGRRRDRYDDDDDDDDDDRRYDRRPPPRYRDEDESPRRNPDRGVRIEGSRKVEEIPRRRDEDRSYGRDDYRPSLSYDDRELSERPRRPISTKEPYLGSSAVSRNPDESVAREKRYQEENTRGSPVRPLSAKDVIEAANRQSDTSQSNARNVFYPVFDPRQSNLTSSEVIQPGERRGTTIALRKRRYA